MTLPFLPADPTGIELTLWFCAVAGSLFFILRVAIVLIAGFEDFDAIDDGSGMDGGESSFDDSSADADHTEAAFKLVSLNTISAFVMMFGWAGLTSKLQFELGALLSIVLALLVGFFSMVVTAWMYMFAKRLASRGADFHIKDSVGLTGSVYQEISEGGLGKIQVSVNGYMRELQARCEKHQHIASFTNVLVTGTIDNQTVTVEKVEKTEEGV